MAMKIRLARGGSKKRPFFNVVVADSRERRDGRFIEKLGYHIVLEAMEIAMAAPVHYRKTFRYFCGICWNKIREQDAPTMPDVMPWEKDGR